MKIIERNLQEIGKSLLVTLPKQWTRALKLRKGSAIKMQISDSGMLTIAPEMISRIEKKEEVLPLDKYFARRFFKEYFRGDEKITFTIGKNYNEEDRKKLNDFLKKFMNVQIIEETKNKIIVKVFKIDELSIQECLSRMFFLSLNIFEETVGQNNMKKKLEIDETITRFYYMLVMQVRRYLEEGKYFEENQISLIKAMDYRMVAERIERVADVLKSLEGNQYIADIKEYYSKAYYSFKDMDFDSALELMIEYPKLLANYQAMQKKEETKKNINQYKQLQGIINILVYSKEISMLVR